MKLLVTGGAGYIGSHAVLQLIENGHQVVVLDNLYSGHLWAVDRRAHFVKGDVGDVELVRSVLRENNIEGVLHFAAHIEVEESVRDPLKYYKNNTASTLNFFEACRAEGVLKIIYSSTAAVYGAAGDAPLTETETINPVSPYGATKMMSERILADVARAGVGPAGGVPADVVASGRLSEMKYVILRYFNVAGAHSSGAIGQATPRATHLVKIAAETALGKRSKMSVFGTDYDTADGTCERDYVHVEDLVDAHINALEFLNRGGESDTFNVGYGKPYSVRAVIQKMKEISGVDFQVVEAERRAGDPAALTANSAKIRRVLDWKPRCDDLGLICRSAYEWEKNLASIKQASP